MILYLLHGIIVNLFIVKSKPFNSSNSKLVKCLRGKGRNLHVCSGWDMVASSPLPNRSLLVAPQPHFKDGRLQIESTAACRPTAAATTTPPRPQKLLSSRAEKKPVAGRSNNSSHRQSKQLLRRDRRRCLKKHETNGWLWSVARVTSLQCVY